MKYTFELHDVLELTEDDGVTWNRYAKLIRPTEAAQAVRMVHDTEGLVDRYRITRKGKIVLE